jgi:hypothetical protein
VPRIILTAEKKIPRKRAITTPGSQRLSKSVTTKIFIAEKKHRGIHADVRGAASESKLRGSQQLGNAVIPDDFLSFKFDYSWQTD